MMFFDIFLDNLKLNVSNYHDNSELSNANYQIWVGLCQLRNMVYEKRSRHISRKRKDPFIKTKVKP